MLQSIVRFVSEWFSWFANKFFVQGIGGCLCDGTGREETRGRVGEGLSALWLQPKRVAEHKGRFENAFYSASAEANSDRTTVATGRCECLTSGDHTGSIRCEHFQIEFGVIIFWHFDWRRYRSRNFSVV